MTQPTSRTQVTQLARLRADWARLAGGSDCAPDSWHSFDALARQISGCGPDGADFLLAALTSEDFVQITAALDYLPFSDLDPARAIAAARPFCEHPIAAVRASAIDALRHLGARDAVPAIARFLDDPAWPVRNAALSYLVWHDPKAGITEAVGRLKDHHPRIREHAMDIVNERQETGAVDDLWDVILPLIGDRDPVVRSSARTFLLRRLPQALPDPSNLPGSPVEWLRAVHACSLAATDGPLAVRLYATDPSPIVRLNLIESLASWSNRTQLAAIHVESPGILDLLGADPDPAVRAVVLDLLSP